jgi:hypothetical protein
VIVPSSIKHDGSRDVTDQLNQVFASAKDGTTVTFQPKGRYRVDGTLTLANRSRLTFAGAGCVIDGSHVQGDSYRAQWRATGGGPFYWRNMTVKGSRPSSELDFNPALQWQHGFDLESVNGYDIAFNVTVTDTWGDGIYNGGGTRDGVIHAGASFVRNGRMAVALTHATGISIFGIKVTDPCMNAIDIEPNGVGDDVTDITATGGTMTITRNAPQPFHSILYAGNPNLVGGNVSNVKISGWRLAGYPVAVVVTADPAHRWSDLTVEDNTSDVQVFTDSSGKPEYAGLTFANLDGVAYSGNTVPENGVDIQNCTGVVSQ